MSRFQKLSHVIWHCQYPIVWIPKYRYKVLNAKLKTCLPYVRLLTPALMPMN